MNVIKSNNEMQCIIVGTVNDTNIKVSNSFTFTFIQYLIKYL